MSMTPKEKAKYLYDKYLDFAFADWDDDKGFNLSSLKENAKQCALIAIDEILSSFGLICDGKLFYTEYRAIKYWEEVKQEIEKL